MKRSSKVGRLMVASIAAVTSIAIGAVAAGEDDAKSFGTDYIPGAIDVDRDIGNSAFIPPQLKAGGDAPFQGGAKFSGEGEPAAEEGEQPLQEGGCSDPPFQAKINYGPSMSANLPEGDVPTCEEEDPPQQTEEPPPPPPIVMIDNGAVADDAGELVEEANDGAQATLPLEFSPLVDVPLHWTGSGGCATLMPGAPASAGSALTFLLWLAPLAAIRRGNKRAS